MLKPCPVCKSENLEMYEALKMAYRLPRPWMDGGITFAEWETAVDRIERVIAKAEGK